MARVELKDILKEIIIAWDEIQSSKDTIKEGAYEGDGASPLDIPVQEPGDPDVEPEQLDSGPDHISEEYSVVGDTRRLVANAVSTNLVGESPIVGEAWQDEDGKLFGTGIFSVMLFEPMSQKMYRESSIGLDVSPLAILGSRIGRSPFIRIKWEMADV